MQRDGNFMKTGLGKFVILVAQMCRLFDRFEATIVTAINASTLSSGDKAKALDAVTAISTGCHAIRLLAIHVER
jgi:hypothetical protein